MTLPAWSNLASIGLHTLLGLTIVFILPDPPDASSRSTRVPIEVTRKPKAPEPKPEPPPPPPPPPVRVPPAMRPRPSRPPVRRRIEMPPPKPPATTPPPRETPPTSSAPPVFGVTMESIVEGDSSVAADVGNTLAMDPEESPRPRVPPAGSPREEYRPEVVPPRVLRQIRAPYPREALEAGIEGKVLLLVKVDTEGRVIGVRVLRGVGHGLDEAAVEAVRQFTFKPGTVDGRSGPMEIRYTYTFVIDE